MAMADLVETRLRLAPELLLRIHDLMVQARALEERLIKMYKQSDGFFWIGGPGEEAFNVPLGLLVDRGEGPAHDYLHFHYRQSATMLALGMEPVDALRQMKNTASDPFSAGRNFIGHFSKRAWNVVPVSSPIEVQYAMAPGTAIAQKRHPGGTGVTVVTGGDAGTAEGDFASCLVWASRPGNELPILIVVTNNGWGISTPASTQHGEPRISDRGKAFGIRSLTVDGNDAEESYLALADAFAYIRRERRPVLLEARVSRLYGHSSASGANRASEETDCLTRLEARLEAAGVLDRAAIDRAHARWDETMLALAKQVRDEPQPDGAQIWRHVYAGDEWGGLPGRGGH